jgi:Arc/MetJ family transcription regulator
MQITVTMDDALIQRALAAADRVMSPAEWVQVALETFVRMKSAQRLAALGGAQAEMAEVARRREDGDE